MDIAETVLIVIDAHQLSYFSNNLVLKLSTGILLG